jgi:small subunit ribosomal protein S1
MATTTFPTRDDFAELLNKSLGGENEAFEGKVVKGTVTAIENDLAVIDVGLKSEGRVPLREFAAPGQKAEISVGDTVEVYVDRVENSHGEAMLSRDRARREAAWDSLEKEFSAGNRVEGVIFGRVKGGFTVDLGGAVAFLPGSQVDIRPVRDVGPLMEIPQPFQVLKMDRRRGNIVVSRRAILEETRAEPSWKRPAPSSAAASSSRWPRARSSTAWSRTSPITVRSSTSAGSTACCTSRTSATSASTTRARC